LINLLIANLTLIHPRATDWNLTAIGTVLEHQSHLKAVHANV
jgi:hypothetical protein